VAVAAATEEAMVEATEEAATAEAVMAAATAEAAAQVLAVLAQCGMRRSASVNRRTSERHTSPGLGHVGRERTGTTDLEARARY
jgi:hypothetical protein